MNRMSWSRLSAFSNSELRVAIVLLGIVLLDGFPGFLFYARYFQVGFRDFLPQGVSAGGCGVFLRYDRGRGREGGGDTSISARPGCRSTMHTSEAHTGRGIFLLFVVVYAPELSLAPATLSKDAPDASVCWVCYASRTLTYALPACAVPAVVPVQLQTAPRRRLCLPPTPRTRRSSGLSRHMSTLGPSSRARLARFR